MSLRENLSLAAAAVVGCNGQLVRVGLNDGGTVAEESGAQVTPGFDAGGPYASDDSAASSAAGFRDGSTSTGDDSAASVLNSPNDGASPRSTIEITTCEGEPPDASAIRGLGFTALSPAECSDPLGAPHPVASAAEVLNLLAGTWSACAGQAFGMPVDSANGVELTSDGQYRLLGPGPDDSFVRLDSIAESNGAETGAGSGLAAEGTYDVVDGSATYGPGTYELQLHPANGGVFSGQIVVTDTPRQFLYEASTTSSQTFSPSATWSVRAGVCSCLDEAGIKVSESDRLGLAAAMTGRWLWCGNEPVTPQPYASLLNFPWLHEGPAMGIEFSNDSRWFVLREDVTGALVRGTGATDYGTLQIVSTAGGLPTWLVDGTFLGPEPLSVELQNTTGTDYAQTIVTENPRVLLLNTFNTAGAVSYSIFFPVP